jgi:hypothetical protein
MKKINILLSLLFLMAMSVSAQKNLKKQIIEAKKKQMIEFSKKSADLGLERKANYLLDSLGYFGFEGQDSTKIIYYKYKYLPDGKVKETELFFDLGFFIFNLKTINTWNLAKNTLTKTDTYSKEDDTTPFVLVGIDSFFYDAKNREILSKAYDVDENSDEFFTIYKTSKYTTNYNTPDSTYKYSFDDLEQKFLLEEVGANILDSKGNIKDGYLYNILDEDGTKESYVYNANNQIISVLTSISEDGVLYEKDYLIDYKLNAKGLAAKTYEYSEWDSSAQTWGDSTLTTTTFTTFDKPDVIENSVYDETTSTWVAAQKVISFYDKNNNLIVDKVLEDDGTGFQLTTKIYSWWSFYKDAIKAKDIFQKGYDLTFQNPFENGNVIKITAPSEQIMNLDIYDINGRLVSHQIVGNQQTVATSFNIAGQFLAVLTSENGKLLTMKRIVKM